MKKYSSWTIGSEQDRCREEECEQKLRSENRTACEAEHVPLCLCDIIIHHEVWRGANKFSLVALSGRFREYHFRGK
jgi:hypothetical protein